MSWFVNIGSIYCPHAYGEWIDEWSTNMYWQKSCRLRSLGFVDKECKIENCLIKVEK